MAGLCANSGDNRMTPSTTGKDAGNKIPCADPRRQYLLHKQEIDAAITRVLESGWYILGSEVAAFEDEFGKWLGNGIHATGVGSGTEALHLALAACGVKPGDEVITVSHTAVATASAIVLAGARPVFVDIDPETFTLAPRHLAGAMTPATRAIIPVHLYGRTADMDAIMDFAEGHGLRVIEDCAQAHGATYRSKRAGTMGHAAAFSFYPTKNLGALGDGGMVVSRDPEISEQVRLLREYGWRERFVSRVPGWNSRLDELQAAILRVKLQYLDREIAERRRIAATYDRELAASEVETPFAASRNGHAYHLYVIRCNHRDRLREHLAARGVGTGIHYPAPIHLQPAFKDYAPATGVLEHTERAAGMILSLPMFAGLTDEEVARVTAAIGEFAP